MAFSATAVIMIDAIAVIVSVPDATFAGDVLIVSNTVFVKEEKGPNPFIGDESSS